MTAAVVPDDSALARATVERLKPPRWTLEWYLPRWLGGAFAVDARVVDDLVLANVLGLVAVRLADDLTDDELEPVDVPRATRLSEAAYAEALTIYRLHFDAESRVWPAIRRAMARWRKATADAGPGSAGTERSLQRRRIARRGEPLTICAVAICLLSGREADLRAINGAIEHALTAWVLADDASDWEADLRAGRANAFLATLLATAPAVPADDLRAEAIAAMLTTDALERYHRRIEREAEQAASIAERLGLTEFADHVRRFGERQGARGRAIQARYHAFRDRATAELLGAT
jgi:hypothetical protein